MEKEMFKSKRWTEYQNVEVLKTRIQLTEEDKKKAEQFRKFIDEKMKNEEDTNEK